MQFVLHGLEKLLGYGSSWVIVHARGVDFQYFAVKYLFSRPNVPNAVQQFFEIASALLEQLIVHGEALDEIFPQTLGCPNTKLCAS